MPFLPRPGRRREVVKVFELGDLQGIARADADPRLSMRAKWLFGFIVKREGKVVSKDVQDIANATPQEVKVTFKELVDHGYIRRTTAQDAGGAFRASIEILV